MPELKKDQAPPSLIAVFATTSTSTSPAPDGTIEIDRTSSSLFRELEEFLVPSGYQQTREDP
ncbi:MAG TPA: hypothetical protein VF172_09595 [Nitrososphaera sp.]